ncbi:MAG: AhpC/TSA family protein, partial [Pseudomonadota bacterium]
NAPFSRPGLGDLLNGLKFVMKNGYPIRGTA